MLVRFLALLQLAGLSAGMMLIFEDLHRTLGQDTARKICAAFLLSQVPGIVSLLILDYKVSLIITVSGKLTWGRPLPLQNLKYNCDNVHTLIFYIILVVKGGASLSKSIQVYDYVSILKHYHFVAQFGLNSQKHLSGLAKSILWIFCFLLYWSLVILLLVGRWTKSPADGNKSRSLPGLIYQLVISYMWNISLVILEN